MSKPSKSAVLVKKKVWLPLIAPAMFNNQQFGEMYLEEPESAVGRNVKVSLMVLSGDPQRQNVHVKFEITKVENNQLFTKLVGYSIVSTAVRKMMRRGRDRIDESFITKTKDGVVVRVKPVLITRARIKSGIMADMRKQLRIKVAREVNNTNFLDFLKNLIAHKFQRELQDSLRRVYPLQTCEIRDIHIETSEKALKTLIMAPPMPAAQPQEKTPETPKAEA